MSLGDFTAFNNYFVILVFPVIMIGFMSQLMAQASASYQRIAKVLDAPEHKRGGDLVADLRGDIAVRHVVVAFGDKTALKDVSFSAAAGTKTAVIGPTAAGKTQLLYLLTGLLEPASGSIEYDGRSIGEYDEDALHRQVGFVFQDSIIFNLTLRENIAFSKTVTDDDLEKAIVTAELKDFVDALPDQLNTIVSERGSSLSGGQKQRIMLARALALNPRVLLLGDFRRASTRPSADYKNVHRNYPDHAAVGHPEDGPVEEYDQIVLLMEGEVLATGTHQQLLDTSPEYVQIYDSQRSTSHYELLRAQ
jgi:ATP-binding cassette subfamily B protein